MQSRSQAARLVLQALFAGAIAVSGAAMAVEAEQYVPEASMSRDAARSDMAQAASQVSHSEASVFVDRAPAAPRDAAEVRAEARQAARDHHFNELYVGA